MILVFCGSNDLRDVRKDKAGGAPTERLCKPHDEGDGAYTNGTRRHRRADTILGMRRTNIEGLQGPKTSRIVWEGGAPPFPDFEFRTLQTTPESGFQRQNCHAFLKYRRTEQISEI